jgi:DNA-binding CsgD family transcriptional regulator/tetratricopeptide (TPR) repeat protein
MIAVRGRDSELELIEAALRRAAAGSSSVILIEGEPGIGKSLLLSHALHAATRQGFTTVDAVADEFSRMIPLGPLLLALNEMDEPGGENPVGGGRDPEDPDLRMSGLAWVRCRLEHLAASGPVLVTADDLQHADSVTLLALRTLPRQFAGGPLCWIFARSIGGLTRSADGGSEAERLFDLLHHDGAQRLRLGPLPERAIAELIADLAGAPPDESLLALAGSTGGNPFLVRELLDSLNEEKLLLIRSGQASAAGERVPQRVREFIQHRIETALPEARQLIQVAAILGPSFAADDVAELLGQSPAALLPLIDEALAAEILTSDGETLSFKDHMTWRAVMESIPDSLSRALHRQFGQVLLDRGNELQAATHLMRGVRQGDAKMLGEIDGLVRRILPNSPQTAADLAVRALELTAAADPLRADRSVAAVRALASARRLQEADKLLETWLAAPLYSPQRARLRNARLMVLTLSGRPDLVRTEAQALLAEPGLPAGDRDEATVALLQALGELPGQAEAEDLASRVIVQPDQAGGGAVAAAKALRAALQWNQGHIAAGLALAREAVAPDAARGGHVPFGVFLDLAGWLVDVRMFDEASAVLSVRRTDDSPVSLAIARVGPALLRARMHLAAGRMNAAQAEAQAVVDMDPGTDECPAAVLTRSLLALIALRQGNLAAASRWLDSVSFRLAQAGTGRQGILCRIFLSQVAGSRDSAAEALGIARDVYDYVGTFRWPLGYDPSVPPWLIRLALAAGDSGLAVRVGGVIDEFGDANPEFPVITAACAHARGLLDRSIGLLQQSAQTQPDPWEAASAAEDLAILLAGANRNGEAIEWLDSALGSFQRAGAGHDAARVRGRLRRLGVRRQHGRSADRPLSGVDSLTETERQVAVLVSQGLTNRKIADQIFVSSNTVAFHIRNIYRKLGVSSRVQLAKVFPNAADAGARQMLGHV